MSTLNHTEVRRYGQYNIARRMSARKIQPGEWSLVGCSDTKKGPSEADLWEAYRKCPPGTDEAFAALQAWKVKRFGVG